MMRFVWHNDPGSEMIYLLDLRISDIFNFLLSPFFWPPYGKKVEKGGRVEKGGKKGAGVRV
jgi:hypothetical protein